MNRNSSVTGKEHSKLIPNICSEYFVLTSVRKKAEEKRQLIGEIHQISQKPVSLDH